MSVVRMPRLSDSMTEATIVAWLKHPGEPFVRGEPLVEVETDKATVVYEAEADGVLAEILVAEGDSAPLGAPIARLEGGDPAAAVGKEAEIESRAASTERAAPATRSAVVGVRAFSAETVRHKAMPVARRTAAELGVPLQGVSGTGSCMSSRKS